MTRELRNVTRDKVIEARALRAKMTPSEVVMWDQLRGRRLAGMRFRRQHPVLGYVVDFYCHELRLAVEIDGDIHRGREAYDEMRSKILRSHGIEVIRLRNEDVIHNLPNAIRRIDFAVATRRRCSQASFAPETVHLRE